MKYVILLRGINVGGHTKVSMKELKEVLENQGYTNVITYINSGNVIVETSQQKNETLRNEIEQLLEKTFHMPLKVVIRSEKELRTIAENVPSSWKNETDIRCYVAFVREPATVEDVFSQMETREDIDTKDAGEHVVYMTTKMEGLTKSRFSKLAGTKIYQDITIRNYNTLKKIIFLME